jgi:thiol-disulfide isomerase/thioredoxin
MTAIKHFVEITTKKEFDEFCSDARYVQYLFKCKYTVDFSQLKIIHFYAQWCSACPEMDILLKEFQQEFKGFDVARINAEEVTEISTAHSVTCVPTILFYKVLFFTLEEICDCFSLPENFRKESYWISEMAFNLLKSRI